MASIQESVQAMSGRKVRRFFRQVANIIPANAACTGVCNMDANETHVQFMFGNTFITVYMTEGGAL